MTSTAECQARLIELWEKNLGIPIQHGADYFQVGGNSLLGTQLLSWIQEGFGIELSLLDLFESRTIAAQTQLVLARQAHASPASRARTEYRFFGPRDQPLFGALHHPQAARARSGVILCYPMGQEYMRIHRTYVELARALAAAGQYVLRFDYFGCGDSAGEATDGDLLRWTADIRFAMEELRRDCAIEELYLVGSRIGANLALEASAGAAGLVLWEPIVKGSDYIATLERAHHDLLTGNAELDDYPADARTDCVAEWVGFPITQRLYDQVVAIDLLATAAPAKGLVVANTEKPALQAYLAARRHLDYVAAGASDGIWLKEDRKNKGLIPVKAVQAIATWIARSAA